MTQPVTFSKRNAQLVLQNISQEQIKFEKVHASFERDKEKYDGLDEYQKALELRRIFLEIQKFILQLTQLTAASAPVQVPTEDANPILCGAMGFLRKFDGTLSTETRAETDHFINLFWQAENFRYQMTSSFLFHQKTADELEGVWRSFERFYELGNQGSPDDIAKHLSKKILREEFLPAAKKFAREKRVDQLGYYYVTSNQFAADAKDQNVVFNVLYHADKFFNKSNIAQLERLVTDPNNKQAVERLKKTNKQTDSKAYKRSMAWVNFIRVISFGFKRLSVPLPVITDNESIYRQAWANYKTPARQSPAFEDTSDDEQADQKSVEDSADKTQFSDVEDDSVKAPQKMVRVGDTDSDEDDDSPIMPQQQFPVSNQQEDDSSSFADNVVSEEELSSPKQRMPQDNLDSDDEDADEDDAEEEEVVREIKGPVVVAPVSILDSADQEQFADISSGLHPATNDSANQTQFKDIASSNQEPEDSCDREQFVSEVDEEELEQSSSHRRVNSAPDFFKKIAPSKIRPRSTSCEAVLKVSAKDDIVIAGKLVSPIKQGQAPSTNKALNDSGVVANLNVSFLSPRNRRRSFDNAIDFSSSTEGNKAKADLGDSADKTQLFGMFK